MTGKELRQWRLSHGWTQVEAAKALGIYFNHLAKMERDEYPVTHLVALATRALPVKRERDDGYDSRKSDERRKS